ncbi:MAG: glycoside hydrolase family 127 protein [Planctomycetes bacterium]|nr:glycoside hydrolase family 127 protein [Planctomycetota bacterium]
MANKIKRRLAALPLKDVDITGGFWAPFMRRNREVTLPAEYEHLKQSGHLDLREWPELVTGTPRIYMHSDVAKWIEAASYSLVHNPDKAMERRIDKIVAGMADVQEEDGYLNAYYSLVEPGRRWTNLRDCHELYCAGHLMEAAVAYHSATAKTAFLDMMKRNADHIAKTFGRKRGQKRGYPGHEEIELALVRLSLAAGEDRYLELARYFIDERGRNPHYFDIEAAARNDKGAARGHGYYQAHLPVRKQDEAVGHAVRACYLYAGMADVAALTGDGELFAACRRLWESVTGRKMYVTGGIGSTAYGERFTADYDMPDDSAYAETCAAIALLFFAWRMLGIDPRSCYADVMERALYNGILSGISQDGAKFFYGNPLASYPGFDGNGTYVGPGYYYRRSEWFGCACCPPNIARLIASLGSYIYSLGRREIWIHLFAESSARMVMAGKPVVVSQHTDYPWDGDVTVSVDLQGEAAFRLALRIPGWCSRAGLKINGRRVDAPVKNGYAVIDREWRSGDCVKMELDMPVERVYADPLVRRAACRVALQRGPVVYCLEETDNGPALNSLRLPTGTRLTASYDKSLFDGAVVIEGEAVRTAGAAGGKLYGNCRPVETRGAHIRAVPYFLWANRNPGEMLVWLGEQRS